MRRFGSTGLRCLQSTVLALSVFSTAAFAAGGGPPPCVASADINPNNQTVTEGATVHLNGAASKPNPATYLWTQVSGPAVTLSSTIVDKPTFVAPAVGPGGASVVLKLTVSGCSPLLSDSVNTTINITDVAPVNQPPVAAATVSPAVVIEGDTVTLDGSSSYDPDGDALTYSWSQIAGTPTVSLSNPSGAVTTFVAPNTAYPSGASFTFRLTVSDGILPASYDVTVNVVWVNDPPVASLSCPESVDEGQTVTLDASASSDDDNGIASYAWSQLMGPPNVDVSGFTTPVISFTAPQLGFHNDGALPFQVTVTDNGDLYDTADCTVMINDVTPPELSGLADQTVEATSAAGAAASFDVTAYDLVDGDVAVNCDANSGDTFPLGDTVVHCSASDSAGNTADGSFTITVQDTTPPTISAHDDVTAFATSASGAVVTYDLPTAYDLVDGSVPVDCTPASGSTFAVGSTEVDCSATDAHGNTAHSSFNVIVTFNFNGFFRPIDNLPVVNTTKAGSAVPVKFSLGGDMGLAIMAAGYPKSAAMYCSGGVQDAVEETVTSGSSSLSYDPTSGQYIYVWKTDKAWAGTCRQLQVKFTDGTVHVANFSFTR